MRSSVSSVIQSVRQGQFKLIKLLLSAIALVSIVSLAIKISAVAAGDWGNVSNAGIYRFKVGSFKVATISDGLLKLPPLPTYLIRVGFLQSTKN